MLNNVLANTTAVEVKVVYGGNEYLVAKEIAIAAAMNNDIAQLVPDAKGDCKVDSFKKVDGELVITVSSSNIVIDKASIVDSLIDVIQQKSVGMSHIQLVLDSKKEYDSHGNVISEEIDNFVGYIKLPENLASRNNVFKFEEQVFRDGKNHVRIPLDGKNPATSEILSVKYGNDEEQGELVLKYGLYKFTNKFGMYSFYRKQGGWLIDLETGETIKHSLIETSTILAEGWTKFSPFGASPSNERQKVIYMIDTTEGYERAHKALNILTYGAYDIDLVGSSLTYEELAKISSRWFQWMAPSSSLGLIEAYAIYCGKFNKDKLDGMSFRRATSVSDKIKNKFGITISSEAILGMFEQSRDGQSKVGDMPIDDELFNEVVYHLDREPLFFLREEITPVIQRAIEEGMKGRGNLANRVVCIGSKDIRDVEAIHDTNGMKSAFDFTQQLDFTLLRILRSNKSNMSKSIFDKMLVKDKDKAIEIMTELLQGDVFNRLDRAYISVKPTIIDPEKLSDEKWYTDEIISSIFPSYLKMDKNLSINFLENITTAFSKILNKFKVPMIGRNSGITVGIETIFNIDSFIGDHEVFSPVAERMLKKEERADKDWKLFMIKYPSMDINEYSVVKVISKSKLKARIKAAQKDLGFSKKRMNMFIKYYMTLHDSVMVVPACELFKNKHAGSDFDTDQVSWSIHEGIVSVLEQDKDNNMTVVIK